MAVLQIRLFPDPILRKPCVPILLSDLELKTLLKNLVETLYAQPGGIGIAAPQVGAAKRLIIIDVSSKDSTQCQKIMINPKIRWQEGEVLSREGCMSIPDYTANIKRAEKVLIEWTDPHGKKRERTVFGIEAICLQHEIDHLNGKLFIDRVVSLKTDIFPRAKRRLRLRT